MSTPRSRYRPDAAPDYSHRFHAGNVGDVWKHCALVEVLRRAAATGRVVYVDTHAGDGVYSLGKTGEWTEGIGRLWGADPATGDDTVTRYVGLCRSFGTGGDRPGRYPGSPALARAVLGRTAELALWESDPTAFATLARHLGGDARTRPTRGDGLDALPAALAGAEARADAVVALIDPPWAQKADWTLVPDALARAVRRSAAAHVILWYPVKSLTRPNAMQARLRAAGISATVAELITTPLDHQRQRLNGSGVLLVRPPDGALGAIAAAAPLVGSRCATRDGSWSFRMVSW